jgi:hypothetical protein
MGSVTLDVDTLIYMAILVVIGFQSIAFYLMAKKFAISEKLLPEDKSITRILKYLNLESGLIISVLLILAGLIGSLMALSHWHATSFGNLEPTVSLRLVIPSILCLLLGVQLFFSSFFISILDLKKKNQN